MFFNDGQKKSKQSVEVDFLLRKYILFSIAFLHRFPNFYFQFFKMQVIAVTVIHLLCQCEASSLSLKSVLNTCCDTFFQAKTVTECKIVTAVAPVQNAIFK